MSQNSKRSKRLPQKTKKYEDYVSETKKPENQQLSCKGCENVFKNRKILLHHQAQCMNLKVDLTKQSFFGGITSFFYWPKIFGGHYQQKEK